MEAPAGVDAAAAIAAARGSSFYWGFLFLPARKRRALEIVYGFCRAMDDIVDSASSGKAQAQKELDGWRAEVERMFSGRPSTDLGRRLLPVVDEFKLPQKPFQDLITGVEMDLKKDRYATFEELDPYLYGVAVTVGNMCVEIFGYPAEAKRRVAEYSDNMGRAVQLTNILRDVGGDLEQGRVYIPLADIKAAGYSMDALVRREHSAQFRTLMSSEFDRAKTFYQRARSCLGPAERPSLAPAEVMGRVYEDLLDEIKARDFRVFFDRVRLPGWRKAASALRGWASAYGVF